MKRFTALALAVVMMLLAVSSAIPVFAVDVAKAENLQEAMNKGEDVTLTGDVDLSTIEWETISEYAGTLDGKGYTITVPSDTTFIDKLSGTVKNVNLTGKMVLDENDASAYKPVNDLKGGGIGGLANYAWGATIENVNSDIEVLFSQSAITANKLVNYGGIVGNAWSANVITGYVKDENAGTIEFTKDTVIKNCSVGGSAYLYFSGYKNAVGGIVGFCAGRTTVEGCATRTNMYIYSTSGQIGGIVGSAYNDSYKNAGNGNPSNFVTATDFSRVKNCLFDGKFSIDGRGLDQAACIVGYARGLVVTSCYSAGEFVSRIGGTVRHTFSYTNIKNTEAHLIVTIEGCASTATVTNAGKAQSVLAAGKTTGFFVKNNILMTGQSVSITDGTDEQNENNNVVGDATAVKNAFVAANNSVFELSGGKVKLVRENTIVAAGADPKTFVPSGETIYVDTAEEFCEMYPGNTYVLQKDITLVGTSFSSMNITDVIILGGGHTVTLNGKALYNYLYESEVYDLVIAGAVNTKNATANVTTGSLAVDVKNVVLNNIVNNATINVSFKVHDKTEFGGNVGGLIGYASGWFEISNCINNGKVTVDQAANSTKNFKTNVGGLIGYTVAQKTKPYSSIKYCINNADISYGATGKGKGNVGGLIGNAQASGSASFDDDLVIYQCANRGSVTGNICGERVGGLLGYYGDVNVDLCYNTGKLTINNTATGGSNGIYGLCGYANTASDSNNPGVPNRSLTVKNCYVFVNEYTDKITAVAQTGNPHGAIIKGNYAGVGSFKDTKSNTSLFKEYSASGSFTSASDLLAKLEANQATAGVFVADDCNINYGYPIFAWEAHDYVTLYEENEKNYVTTGKDLDCDKYNNAEFAGFVQFANDSNKVRFIMAIDADYLAEASTKYESFDVVITVNGDKTANVNSRTLSSYKEVTAGTDVYYADECEIFGFIMNFGDTVVSSLDFKIVIGEETFELGSYTAN